MLRINKMSKTFTKEIYRRLFEVFGKSAMSDQMQFSLIASVVTVIISLAIYYFGYFTASWPKMNLGIYGIFVSAIFFAHFAITNSILQIKKSKELNYED